MLLREATTHPSTTIWEVDSRQDQKVLSNNALLENLLKTIVQLSL